LIYTYILR